MSWMDRLLGRESPTADLRPASGGFSGRNVQALSIPDILGWDGAEDFLRGDANFSGEVRVTARTVMRNPSVRRCVNLIANTVGMLPLQLLREGHNSGDRTPAKDNGLYDVLARRPNNWQTAFVFRRLMQRRALTFGNAYALPIVSRGMIVELIPIANERVRVVQANDWSVEYLVRAKSGTETRYPSDQFFHLMGDSEDGLTGTSLVLDAGEVLGLALQAQRAASRTFSNGMSAGGALEADKSLTPEALANLRESMDQGFSGSHNAGKWLILEEGLTAKPFGVSAKDAQNVEQRSFQIEEVARIFGVPRPFLMVDDTSWGTGIEQLAIFFVTYGLAPWFIGWEQAIERTLLTEADRRAGLYAKFNERALLRGSIKDQGEFFAKALGSGGGPAWMTQDEVRSLSDLSAHGAGASELSMGMTAKAGGGI